MDREAALAAFDRQLRNVVRPSLGGGRFERAGRVIRCVSPAPDGWNGVEWSELDESSVDAVIAEQVAFFTGLGRTFEWKYYAHDRPAGLPDRLLAAGLRPGEEEALMLAEVADGAAGSGRHRAADGHRRRRPRAGPTGARRGVRRRPLRHDRRHARPVARGPGRARRGARHGR